MANNTYAQCIRIKQKFFNTSTAVFDEPDANFAPRPGMFTVAQHIAHAAQTVRWFIEGAFSPTGMTMDFEGMEKEVRQVKSLCAARKDFNDACDCAIQIVDSKSRSDFAEPIAGHIMADEPREAIFQALADHTAHHRGALTVYARLLGKVPPMPYM